jgi:hypothetical protein
MFDYLKSEYPSDSQSELARRDSLLACQLRSKLQRERRARFPATWVGRRVYPLYAWIVHSLGVPIHLLCHVVRRLSERASRNLDRLCYRLAPYGDPIRAKQRQRRSFSDSSRVE